MKFTLESPLSPDAVRARLTAASKIWRDSERPRYLADLGMHTPSLREEGEHFRLTFGGGQRGHLIYRAVGDIVEASGGCRVIFTIGLAPIMWLEAAWVECIGVVVSLVDHTFWPMLMPVFILTIGYSIADYISVPNLRAAVCFVAEAASVEPPQIY